VLGALRRTFAAAFGLLLTRAESATIELGAARAAAVRWFVLALAAGLFALLALAAASAALTLALWPWLGWATPLALAAIYALAAWRFAVRVRREVEDAPPLLAETLKELGKDRDALLGAGGRGDGADGD
jgi:uncharacterized membrane protein YqjE